VESHSFSLARASSKPFGHGTPPFRGPRTKGTPILASFLASGLGVEGESGVSRCTRSNSRARSRVRKRFHASRSKNGVRERRHRGHDGPALVGPAAQDLGRLVERRCDGLRVDRGERFLREPGAQDRRLVPDLRDEVDVGDLRQRASVRPAEQRHADPLGVRGFGDQEDARPRSLGPQPSPSSRDRASAIPCLRR
jgi:hypothetical protein